MEILNVTFNNISVVVKMVNFIDGGNRSTPRKQTSFLKSLDTLYHIQKVLLGTFNQG